MAHARTDLKAGLQRNRSLRIVCGIRLLDCLNAGLRTAPAALWVILAISAVSVLHAAPPVQSDESSRSIPFVLNSGKIYIRSTINGEPNHWLILDSGSPDVILDASVAERLGLELGEPFNSSGVGNSSFPLAPVREPVSIDLPGGVRVQSMRAAAGPLDRVVGAFEGRRIDGLIGVNNLFHEYVVELDYGAKRVVLHDRRRFTYDGEGVIVPVTHRAGRILVKAKLQWDGEVSADGVFLIDTGLRGGLLINSPFVSRHRLLSAIPRTVRMTVGGGIGGRAIFDVARLDRFQIGSIAINDFIVWLSDPATDARPNDRWAGVLGSAFLQRFHVYFDLENARLILAPQEIDPRAAAIDKSGMFLVSDVDDRSIVRVLEVLADSPAANAGITVGDRIVAINGNDHLSLEAVRSLLRGPERTRVMVTIERNGVTSECELELISPI